MRKSIDINNRLVDMYDVDTGAYEDEIVSYLDKNMTVRFHSAFFNNSRYVFLGKPESFSYRTISVTGYRLKNNSENISVSIG